MLARARAAVEVFCQVRTVKDEIWVFSLIAAWSPLGKQEVICVALFV